MVQGKGFTPKELPSTCLSYPTRPSVHVPTRELASAARSYPSSGKTSIYQGPRRWLRFHEKGGKEYEMPAHHQGVFEKFYLGASRLSMRRMAAKSMKASEVWTF